MDSINVPTKIKKMSGRTMRSGIRVAYGRNTITVTVPTSIGGGEKTHDYEVSGCGISMRLGARAKHPLIAAIDGNYEMSISRAHVESRDNWGQQKETMTDGRLYGSSVCRQKYETRKYPH